MVNEESFSITEDKYSCKLKHNSRKKKTMKHYVLKIITSLLILMSVLLAASCNEPNKPKEYEAIIIFADIKNPNISVEVDGMTYDNDPPKEMQVEFEGKTYTATYKETATGNFSPFYYGAGIYHEYTFFTDRYAEYNENNESE